MLRHSLRYQRAKRPFATIPAWMDATGTSQRELAKSLSISQSHLCNVMRGNRKASLDLALRIAELTNVPVEIIAKLARVA